jgi:hypothetical protein
MRDLRHTTCQSSGTRGSGALVPAKLTPYPIRLGIQPIKQASVRSLAGVLSPPALSWGCLSASALSFGASCDKRAEIVLSKIMSPWAHEHADILLCAFFQKREFFGGAVAKFEVVAVMEFYRPGHTSPKLILIGWPAFHSLSYVIFSHLTLFAPLLISIYE